MLHVIRMYYRIFAMKRTFRPCARTRRRVSWLAIVLLLWQQLAMATYVCAAVPEAAGAAVAVSHAAAMAMTGDCCASTATPAVDPLCQPHCQPEQATQNDVRTASVPVNTLVALPPEWLTVAAVVLPSARNLTQRNRLHAPPPIPHLLFCSLLI